MKALLITSVVIALLLLLIMPATVVGILFLTFLAIDVIIYKDWI